MFRIKGMSPFLALTSKTRSMRRKAEPAIKNPAFILFIDSPIHQAAPNAPKSITKQANTSDTIPTTLSDTPNETFSTTVSEIRSR